MLARGNVEHSFEAPKKYLYLQISEGVEQILEIRVDVVVRRVQSKAVRERIQEIVVGGIRSKARFREVLAHHLQHLGHFFLHLHREKSVRILFTD